MSASIGLHCRAYRFGRSVRFLNNLGRLATNFPHELSALTVRPRPEFWRWRRFSSARIGLVRLFAFGRRHRRGIRRELGQRRNGRQRSDGSRRLHRQRRCDRRCGHERAWRQRRQRWINRRRRLERWWRWRDRVGRRGWDGRNDRQSRLGRRERDDGNSRRGWNGNGGRRRGGTGRRRRSGGARRRRRNQRHGRDGRRRRINGWPGRRRGRRDRRNRRRSGRRRPRRDAADGLELVEHVPVQHQRDAHQGDRRRLRLERHEGRRLPVRQPRRLLDGRARCQRQAALEREQVPVGHARARRLHPRQGSEDRHLRDAEHHHLRRASTAASAPRSPSAASVTRRPTRRRSRRGASTTSSTTSATGALSAFAVMRDALRATGRPIFYSINPGDGSGCPPNNCSINLPTIANMWRIGFDITASWASVIRLDRSEREPVLVRRPGALERPRHAGGRQRPERHRGPRALQHVGDHGGAADRRERPAQHERGDPGHADEQRGDRRRSGSAGHAGPAGGNAGARTWRCGRRRCRAPTRERSRCSIAARQPRPSPSSGARSGIPAGAATVRDLWSHTDLGSFSGSYTASSVPSHGVVMLKVTSTP